MYKGKARILVLLGVFAAGSLVCYQLFTYKCWWWECAQSRDFNIYDLALPETFFPPSANVYPLHEERGIINAIDEGLFAADWNGGGATYKILRFATEKQASEWYKTEVSLGLFTGELTETKEYSPILNFKSNVAKEFMTNCGYVLKDIRCMYWARYQEFFIFFSGSIGETEMSNENFIGVMNYLDARMDELLNSEK